MELDITALDLLPTEESKLALCKVTCVPNTCAGHTCWETSF
ncbi:ALQxL family class IV lanthipeptide [Streptosporangium sp. NPDC001559]